MKGFSMKDGDVIIANNTIEMTEDLELLRQKVERVIATNLGEWKFDVNEGIDYSVVFKKNPIDSEIRATIEAALSHIDETFFMTKFSVEINEKRHAVITFTAINNNGEEVGGVYEL
jgi:hypothetical protein